MSNQRTHNQYIDVSAECVIATPGKGTIHLALKVNDVTSLTGDIESELSFLFNG